MSLLSESKSWVRYTVTRGPIRGIYKQLVGLTIKIVGSDELEQFMRTQASTHMPTMPLDSVTPDGWISLNGEALSVYNLEGSINATDVYTLDALGAPMVIANNTRVTIGNPQDKINLSILRLVGISNPEGITIGFPGMHSPDYTDKLRVSLQQATHKFLHDFLVPSSVTIDFVSIPGKW